MPTPLPRIPNIPLGSDGLHVSALGLGCMVLSGMYAAANPAESTATFHRAIDLGINFLDTANSYQAGINEEVVGSLLGSRRDEVVLASKFGLLRTPDGALGWSNDPEYIRRCCDESLARLRVDHLDLYYAHRLDPAVPVEETIGAMAGLVDAGKVRYLGICEANSEEIHRAHATHPITALQSEWSLWERGIEQSVVPTARELGIGIVPYGPLGRGFLTGAIPQRASLAPGDLRLGDPRLADENIDRNYQLVAMLRTMADAKGATPAQLALAWLRSRGPDVVPIPGIEKRVYLDDNVRSLEVSFDIEELATIDEWFHAGAVAGDADHIHLRDLHSRSRS